MKKVKERICKRWTSTYKKRSKTQRNNYEELLNLQLLFFKRPNWFEILHA